MEMTLKKIGKRGEIVIPKNMRKEKGMEVNSRVEVIDLKNGILIVPLKKKLGDLAGLFGDKGVKNVEELDAITHEFFAGMIE